MFIAQSVLHAFITVIIVEMSFYSWEISNHQSRFRYRLLVLILPLCMFPVFQIINPERGSMYFREDTAIFNINKWLAIRMWDTVPLYALFIALLLLTAAIFIFQEILPIVFERLWGRSRQARLPAETNKGLTGNAGSIIGKHCSALKIECPSVQVVDEPYPVIFTAGTKNHTIMLSKALLEKFTVEQLEAALVHEIIHMVRGSSIKTQMIYLLRMLMFYNPISLIEFRRLVQDDEFICDELTVFLTKKPYSLIEALKVFYSHPGEGKRSKISLMRDVIESHSHNLLLDERIAGLQEKAIAEDRKFGWGKYILTVIVILKINYMVV